MRQAKLFQVKVKSSDALGDRFRVCKETEKWGEYHDCKDNICYVTTNRPGRLWDVLGDSVISVEEIGIGYIFDDEFGEDNVGAEV